MFNQFKLTFKLLKVKINVSLNSSCTYLRFKFNVSLIGLKRMCHSLYHEYPTGGRNHYSMQRIRKLSC